MGFTFDDTDRNGVTNSLAMMRGLIAKNIRNAERVFPLLGGEELSESPTQSPHRFVISFGEMSEQDARRWPDLMQIIEERVKPERDELKDKGGREKWWQFLRPRPELYGAIRDKPQILVNALYGTQFAFVFRDSATVFSNKINVTTFQDFCDFAVLQSRCHEIWARFFSSTLKDDLAYTPSDCFETFPFPGGGKENATLDEAGRRYYQFRAELMKDLWLGLTEIYNLFHSPDEDAMARLESLFHKRRANSDWRIAEGVPVDFSPLATYVTSGAALSGVQRLRELHTAMDVDVLTAYGWSDLIPVSACKFLLDYEDEDEGEETSSRKKKKPWRYRWPDEVRDEVLARLLKLNAERAEEERLAGEVAASLAEKHSKVGRKGKKFTSRPLEGDLLDL